MSETSTKNMSKAKARQSRRGSRRTDRDIQRQLIRKLRRIKKSSGDQAVRRWLRQEIPVATIIVGRGHRTTRKLIVSKEQMAKAVGVSY